MQPRKSYCFHSSNPSAVADILFPGAGLGENWRSPVSDAWLPSFQPQYRLFPPSLYPHFLSYSYSPSPPFVYSGLYAGISLNSPYPVSVTKSIIELQKEYVTQRFSFPVLRNSQTSFFKTGRQHQRDSFAKKGYGE